MSKIYLKKLTDKEKENANGGLAPRIVCWHEGLVPLKCGDQYEPDYITCTADPLGTCY